VYKRKTQEMVVAISEGLILNSQRQKENGHHRGALRKEVRLSYIRLAASDIALRAKISLQTPVCNSTLPAEKNTFYFSASITFLKVCNPL